MTNAQHRLLYSEDVYLEEAIEEEFFAPEWRQHVQTRWALEQVGQLVLARQTVERRLHAAITDARAAGASWTQLALELGVTRQAAHKRWTRPPHSHSTSSPASLRNERP